MAAHLPGMCAAIFPMPVIGVPMSGKNLRRRGRALLHRTDAARNSGGDGGHRRRGRTRRFWRRRFWPLPMRSFLRRLKAYTAETEGARWQAQGREADRKIRSIKTTLNQTEGEAAWIIRSAGVDIEAGYRSVELMKEHVKRDHEAGGAGRTRRIFRGIFPREGFKDMEEPTLLSGTDGVRHEA